MAPADLFLVEAYIGFNGGPAGDVASYFGNSAAASVCSVSSSALIAAGAAARGPQKQLQGQRPAAALQNSRQVVVGRPGATPAVRSARGPRQRPPSAGDILSGDWAPEVKPPRRAVSSDGASVAQADGAELRRLLTPGPQEGLLSVAAQAAKEARQQDAEYMGCSASSCGASQACQEGQGYGAASQVSRATKLSHATTPSWRSRSFPPNFLAKCRAAQEKTEQEDTAGKVRRLPALPDEARPQRGSPPSEVALLSDIASEVHQANALLVESYLNVKRRPISRQGPLSAGSFAAASSCSAEEMQSSRPSTLPPAGARPARRGRKYELELGPLPEALESCPESGPVACC